MRTVVIVLVWAVVSGWSWLGAASRSATDGAGAERKTRARSSRKADTPSKRGGKEKGPAKRGGRAAPGVDGEKKAKPDPGKVAEDTHVESRFLKGKLIRLLLTNGKQVSGKYLSHSWKTIRLTPTAGASDKPVEVRWDDVLSRSAYSLLKRGMDVRVAADHLRLGQYMLRRGMAREADYEFKQAVRRDKTLAKKVRRALSEDRYRLQWDLSAATTRPSDPDRPASPEGNPLDRRTPQKKPKKRLDRGIWFESVHSTGHRGNRIDLVCVGDGYYDTGRDKRFTEAVLDLSKAFRKYSPFREYYRLFNFHVVHVNMKDYDYVKTEGGKQSIFGVSKSRSDNQMLTSDAAAVKEVVDRAGIVADVICLLVKSEEGGSGGGGSGQGGRPACGYMTVGDKSKLLVYVHEAGHAVGGLADEYEKDPYNSGRDEEPLTREPTAPNVTINPRRSRCKWRHWFGVKGVGMYKGAMYRHKGIYRPCRDCIMRDDKRFCVVCAEALVLSFLRRVRLIDRVAPEGNVLETFSSRENEFRVWTIPLPRRSFTFRWRMNGQKVDKKWYKGPDRLVFPEGALQPGQYTFSVRVTHRTRFVRNDPTKYMQDLFVWNVTVKE